MVGGVCRGTYVVVRGQLCGSVLFHLYVGSGACTEVVRLARQALLPAESSFRSLFFLEREQGSYVTHVGLEFYMQPRIALNSLFSCLCLPSTGILGDTHCV